jgi:inhibitor of KinA sporulation pathway (predicted exonuclease)
MFSKSNKKDTKNILILNTRTTCWEKRNTNNVSDIIKMNVCVLNTQLEKITAIDEFIIQHPNIQISTYCSQVTGLSQKDVDNGISFNTVCDILEKEYFANDRIWACYGLFSKNIFYQQCKKYSRRMPMSNDFINIKSLYSLIMQINTEVKLDKAFEMMGMHYSKGLHDEAYYASLLLGSMLGYKKCIDSIDNQKG